MPQEQKKRGRGRRAEKQKRKAEEAHDEDREPKRQRQDEAEEYIALDTNAEQRGDDVAASAQQPGEKPFFGLLDEEEQELFRQADEILSGEFQQDFDINDPETRKQFLGKTFKEAEGKELKLANSQSCSRLLEKLIQLSTAEQLKQLFQKFSGHFPHLVTHRFASHCCEALFMQAAPVVTSEMLKPAEPTASTDPNAIVMSMENLFLTTLRELEPYLGYLMTDKFGSHTLRVLLLILAGEPIVKSQRKGPLQSKKKEHIQVHVAEQTEETALEKRQVPEAFHTGLSTVIAKSVEGLDTTFLQTLATHKTANPTLQLLLQLELSQFGKDRANDENSILRKLLPDGRITEGTESAKFLNHLVYDPVGSRLSETIVEHAPAKTFKAIYREFFKDRLATLARNDIASYVVIKVLSRIGKEDLQEAVNSLIPQFSILVERNRTALIKTIIERCSIRGVPTEKLAAALESAYAGPDGFDGARLLMLADPDVENTKRASGSNGDNGHSSARASEKLHGSLLAQTMIATPGPLSDLIFDALARLGTPLFLSAAKAPSASHAISAALTSPNASVIFRRKMIQQFYGHVGEMALHPSASHVIDAVWAGTYGLTFMRERVAEELAENEASMRESIIGRKVWRNWRMDLYKKKRREWVITNREPAGREGFIGFPSDIAEEKEKGIPSSQSSSGKHHKHKHHKDKGNSAPNEAVERHMTALEKARQRHVQEKAKKEREAAKSAKREKNPRKEENVKEIAVA